jgi:hypothetical protein
MSMTETIRDAHGRIIARIKEEGDEVRLYDAMHRTIGHYSRSRNETRDSKHKPVGPGNQLYRLIPAG